MALPAKPPQVLLISGSLRAGSTNGAVVATAHALAAEAGVTTVVFTGLADLPHFNPDDDPEGGPVHPAVADLRAELEQADAMLFSTPEYAGALPGALKNLLEWTVGGGQTYGMPAGWINASGPAAPTGAADAHASLRKVLGYTGSDIVEAACVRAPVLRDAVGTDGRITDGAVRAQITVALRALAGRVASAEDR